jgi:hypothetical protein
MDDRLSRHRTPSRTRREIFPALFLLALALTAPLATPPPARAQGAGADSVTLSWTAPGDDGNTGTAASYEMRMSQSTITATNWSSATLISGAPDPLPAGTRQSMVVRGLTNGVTYYFAIKARDDAGNVAPISNVVRWDWLIDTAPPQAPSGLSAALVNGGADVRLTWNANVEPDLASYTVYRRLEAGGTFDVLAVGVSGTQYVDNALPQGIQDVWYQLTALDQSGNESAHSATASTALGSSAPATAWNLNPAYPNPGSLATPVNIPIDVPPAGPGSAQLQIVDSGGHLIRRLDLSGLLSGSQTVVWDGKNFAGRPTAPGVYTAWLVGEGSAHNLKIVRVP